MEKKNVPKLSGCKQNLINLINLQRDYLIDKEMKS